MADNVYALLQQAWSVSKGSDANMYGVEVAIVTNVKDPEKQGRVKICFPRLPGKPESDWARVMQPAAGSGRGFYWLPEVSDEVLVAFERGQANVPYVIGALWNGKDKPMKDAYTDDNTRRMIQTRSGHQILFEDKSGDEKLSIADKSGKRTLTFDVKNKKFLVEAKEGDVEIHSKKKIVLQCEDLEIKTSKTGKITIGTKFDLKVADKASFKAGPKMDIKAGKVNLNPPSLSIPALVTAAMQAAAAAAAAASAAAAAAQQQQQAAAAAAPAGPATVPTSTPAASTGAPAPASSTAAGAAGAQGTQPTGAAAPAGSAWTTAPAGGAAGSAAGTGGTAASGTGGTAAAAGSGGTAGAGTGGTAAGTAATGTAATGPAGTAAAAAPQPSLSTDAQNPQPTGAAFNLKWTIANWAQGMTASLSCDKDIGDGKGTSPQDVTSAVGADGSGSLAIAPPSVGAFNAGSFNYTLTVTPQGGTAVASPALAVTVQSAAASATLTAEGADANGQVATDFEKPVTLNWKATGATSAELTCDIKPPVDTFEGTTADGGKLKLPVNLASGSSYTVTMYEGSDPIAKWEFDLAPLQDEDTSPPDLSASPPTVSCAALRLQPLALTLDADGNGQGTLLVKPGPRESAVFTLAIKPRDGSTVQPGKVSVQVTNFLAELKLEDDGAGGADGKPAPDGKSCKVVLGVVADNDDGSDGGSGAGGVGA